MPEAASAILQTDGLIWLALAAFVAGIVRGFAGFGTAMIFLPVASLFLSPFSALTVLIVKNLVGPLPNVPRALKDGQSGDMARLAAGLVIGVPAGIWLLTLVSADVFRYAVSAVALILLGLLISGFRYRGPLTRPLVFAAGAIGGVLGGAVGIPAPPVVLLYMASTLPSQAIRANNTLYLVVANTLMLAGLIGFGKFAPENIGLGIILTLPYLAGNMLGEALFRPGHERLYRGVAYVIIAASAINGLPALHG